MSSSRSHAFAGALICLALSSHAFAADWKNPTTEYRDRIKTAQTIQPLGDTPFGENVDLYKGGLSFRQTDISFPGIGPTITLTRSYSIGGATAHGYGYDEFGDWALSIPRITTILPGSGPTLGGWVSYGTLSDQRCTVFGRLAADPWTPSLNTHWWNGYQMTTPDGATQTLLARDPNNTLTPSGSTYTYNIVTTSNWVIRCTNIDNPGANGVTGQGFIALAPDGTEYTFNHMVYGPALPEITDESLSPINHLPRKVGYMYLTKIHDRFGNDVTYHYNASGKPDSIDATDGRHVSIIWRADGRVITSITLQPGSPAAQTWLYDYGSPTGLWLNSVELPDHTKWLLSMNGADRMDVMSDQQGCSGVGTVPAGDPLSFTITHPSGLVGVFNVGYELLGRSKVPNVCNHATPTAPEYDGLPPYYYAVSLESKSISGPGLTTQTWTYTYGYNASTDPNCATTGCVASSWVDVGAPDGSSIRYTHNAEWGQYEGKLIAITAGKTSSNSVGLRVETHEYAASTSGPYPSHVGDDPGMDGLVNNGPVEYLTPENKVTTVLQGVTFVRNTTAFDKYLQPLIITRSSTGGSGGSFSKTETLTYVNNESAWVLSQPATSTVNGTLASETLYNALTLPTTQKSFGLVQRTLSYNADGTLASVTDPGGHQTTLSQWYRGIPKLISFPTSTTMSAVVDDAGKINSSTDELNNTTSYGYDSAGRLNAITYPTGDPVAWNGLSSTFSVSSVLENGIPPGHWKQAVATGTGVTTTFYDARWLPILILTEDTAPATASKSFVVQRFDGLGRLTFKSYPVSAAAVDDTALKGVTTVYDPLGRPIQSKQDSELGVLVTFTDYLSGFRTQVTNPRGKQTITSYQIFDAPSTDAPVLIQAPQGQTTTIARDAFGAPMTITRSGPGA